MTYDEWLAAFSAAKELVAEFPQSDGYAVHTVRRYIKDRQIWDTAITYTGRLVVRSGVISEDGVTVAWEAWQTLHDVKVEKS